MSSAGLASLRSSGELRERGLVKVLSGKGTFVIPDHERPTQPYPVRRFAQPVTAPTSPAMGQAGSWLTALKTRLRRMRYRSGLLQGFLASTGLDRTTFSNPHSRRLGFAALWRV
jgi:hypothetical protein